MVLGSRSSLVKQIIAPLLLVLAIPMFLYAVSEVTRFFGKAGGVKADIVVDAGATYGVVSGPWRNLAQGGEEKGRMLAPVLDKVRTLFPDYIRIDHIYDSYDVVSRDGSSLSFNWSKLDETISDILAAGAKPFIVISYFPPAISRGDIVDYPVSWSDWELTVQKTVEHISGRDSLNISGVYYEVWNEPDLFGKFKMGRDKNYLDLYLHTAVGAGKAQNTQAYKLGGPATTSLYRAWFDGLLNFIQQNKLRLDFYSWHKYSKNIEDFEKDILNAQTWLTNYPQLANLELVISEWGHNSENDKGYDNYFGAIHTLAVSTAMVPEVAKGFVFEIKDGPGATKYWGRWGLITHENFGPASVKPRYRAIEFLNNMSGARLNVAGQGSFVKSFASKVGDNVKTIVVNYDPSGKHFEEVPITFVNLPSQKFRFKRIDFLGGVREFQIATTSGVWSTSQMMEANTASIFEIIPQ